MIYDTEKTEKVKKGTSLTREEEAEFKKNLLENTKYKDIQLMTEYDCHFDPVLTTGFFDEDGDGIGVDEGFELQNFEGVRVSFNSLTIRKVDAIRALDKIQKRLMRDMQKEEVIALSKIKKGKAKIKEGNEEINPDDIPF